jgi:hypothetical protein
LAVPALRQSVDHIDEGAIMKEVQQTFAPAHRFELGHTVRLSRSLLLPNIADGDYTIVAHLPQREGAFQYRVKSKLEPYERVVKEDQLDE